MSNHATALDRWTSAGRWGAVCFTALLAFALVGCGVIKPSFHEKFHWRAKDFFHDPKVIALCEAIEANDLAEIDRLVKEGADVKALGKGNMTPLLWAYPDNKPERLKKLLELGADPNVVIESDFNTRMSGFVPGDSVTLHACETRFPKYFDYVFAHGGDPNFRHRKTHDTPLIKLIMGPATDKPAKVKRLIELGAKLDANIDDKYTGGTTAVSYAASAFQQYDLALLLLEAGADYKTPYQNGQKLIHTVALKEELLPRMSAEKKAEFQKLVKWLEDHGESMEAARAEIRRLRGR